MIYGYIRVSTPKQSPERQRVNIIRAFPSILDRNVYEEKITGTKIEGRTEFQKLIRKVKPGDTIVFDSVSRMSREAEQGFKLYKKLYEKGVNLVFLKEPYVNSANYRQSMDINIPMAEDEALKPLFEGLERTLMMLAERQFKIAFEQSEKEVKDRSQTTKEGMAEKESGKKISKSRTGKKYETPKAKELKPKIRQLNYTWGGPLNDTETIKLLGISRGTFYKYKNEILSSSDD